MGSRFNWRARAAQLCASATWLGGGGIVLKPIFTSLSIKQMTVWVSRLTLALLSLHSAAALAETAPEAGVPAIARIVLTNQTYLRINPLGLGNQTRIGYQRGLYTGNNPLTQDNFWHVGINLRVTPALVRGSAVLEAQPLTVLNLRATGGYSGYFGTFNSLQSRASAQDDLSDAAMAAHKGGPLGSYATSGWHVELEPTLQFAWGPAFIRDKAMWGWYHAALRPGDRVLYDALLDVPVANGGWVFANDLDLLYRHSLSTARFAIGVRHSVVQPFYPSEASQEAANAQQRLGILVAYTLFDNQDAGFIRPTLVVNVGRYLSHRYREDVGLSAQNLFCLIGFAFQSELWRP